MSGKPQLAPERSDLLLLQPAHIGEAPSRQRRRAGNAEGSPSDPVTTDSSAPRAVATHTSSDRSESASATTRRYLRLASPDTLLRAYLTGYADGEGCFCVTFNKSTRHKFGWDIRPSFSVSQNADRADVLDAFLLLFGCGSIRPDRSDRTLKYDVRSVTELATKVLPHFDQVPLVSSKRRDFLRFSKSCG